MLWYSSDHPSSNQVLVLLLGRLTRLENKLYLWLKFVTINSTEQKQQDRNKICIRESREVCYKSPSGLHRMCFLSGSKCQGYKQCLCPGKPILVSRSEAFMGGWFHRHIMSCRHPAMTLKLRTPVMKPGVYHQCWYLCAATLTNWYSTVHWTRCTPQKSSIHQWHKEHSEIHVSRTQWRVSHGPSVSQSFEGLATRPVAYCTTSNDLVDSFYHFLVLALGFCLSENSALQLKSHHPYPIPPSPEFITVLKLVCHFQLFIFLLCSSKYT